MTLWYRQSAIKAFKECERRGFLSYMQGGAGYEKAADPDRPASGGRDTGTLVHAGLEAYYLGGDHTAPFADAREAHIEEHGELTDEWAKIYSLAQTMVEGYIPWVEENGYDVGERTVSVERAFDVEVGTIRGEIVHVTGKVDRIVEDELTGEFIIEDFKTVDQFKDKRWLAMDDQLQTYAILARLQDGIKANRGRHTELRKVRRGVRAKPPFYNRVEFPFNETQLQNHWTHMMSTLDRMVSASQAIRENPEAHHRYAVPNPGGDCSWKCDFLTICSMLDDGSYWTNALDDLYSARPTPVTITNKESA